MKTATLSTARSDLSLGDLSELVKLRLSLLVLMTTLVGFLAGWEGPMNYSLLAATLIGAALCACGASALNQWWERDYDALMKRTSQRPLPGGRMHPGDALMFGIFFCVTGLAVLGLMADVRAAILGLITIAIYVFVYTPMKRVSSLNTLVGAIPGALPPLIGWVAARGEYSIEGGLIFAILWFWQMPHFLAIAWLYREEYSGAGFVMLPGDDETGFATGRQAFLYSLCLLMVSLVPALLGFNSAWYFFGVLGLGIVFCGFALMFLWQRDQSSARKLFLASILYLPLALGLLAMTGR